jgi:hypothetical protein
MGSGAMIYISRFVIIDSAIQKLIWGDAQTRRQHGDRISLLSFFQNKESRVKKAYFVEELVAYGIRLKWPAVLTISTTRDLYYVG